jgi:DNA-binding NarL/FixJ family response regulator
MRILLVDDDEGFRATLRHLLTQRGHGVRVEEAADGEEALKRVATSQPDAVLMDLTMPRMNGIEATRRLKVRWPELPVLILTVHDDPVYERTARAAGADGFILKQTAGTRLWPALVLLVSRAASGGPERATGDPPITDSKPGSVRSRTSKNPSRGTGEREEAQLAGPCSSPMTRQTETARTIPGLRRGTPRSPLLARPSMIRFEGRWPRLGRRMWCPVRGWWGLRWLSV